MMKVLGLCSTQEINPAPCQVQGDELSKEEFDDLLHSKAAGLARGQSGRSGLRPW